MSQRGPIIVIEDDTNDADVILAAIREIGVKNEVKRFADAQSGYDYLCTSAEQPLVILSDIRMPGMDGLSLLKKIQANDYLRKKAIPFVLFTGIATREIVNEAFANGVQGYYKKADSYVALKDQILVIISYWTRSLHPNVEW